MRKRLWPMLLVFTVLLAVPVGPALAGFAGTDLFIPMAGRGAGAYPSNWFTTVYLYNPNPTAVTVDLTFLERNKDNVATAPPRVTETLAAGETKVYDNIVEATFGKSAYGAVRITCASKVVASARVFSKESADAPLTQSFGQDFAATPASFAIGLNESTDILGGYSTLPYQDSAARFNIGCVETTGAGSATVRWVARDGAGQQQKSYDRVVPRLSQTQGFFHQYFDGIDLTNSRVSASVIAGSGRVICYGSLVTNDKEQPKPVQDPTTFEMVYKDSLLGIATVQHDATLQGDGTAGAPLGLAAGAVSQGKLAAGGGTAGQVLGTDGTSLVWRTPAAGGLVLPYSDSGNTTDPAPLFSLVNLGTGVGLQVDSDGGTRRGALVSSDAGVYGHTMVCGGEHRGVLGLSTCTGAYGELGRPGVGVLGDGYAYGVHGRSADGDGVFGESSASNKSGVFAVNDNPAGWAGFFRGRVGIAGVLECTGCVGKGALAATGGANGQVLGTDGTSLRWQDPTSGGGLTLPFADDATTTGTVFDISNWATGNSGQAIAGHFPQHGVHGVLGAHNVGVSGESINGVGVRGKSSTAAGVYGTSDYYGVLGQSGNNDGVKGTTSESAHAGVFGQNDATGTSGALGAYSAGVDGHGTTYGVRGISDDNTGVFGHGGVYGVHGESDTGDGVFAESTAGYKSGLYAVNDNAAGYAAVMRGRVKATQLQGGGAVYADADGVLTLSSSDRRLKTAIADLAGEVDVLAVLAGLRPVAFTWDTSQVRATRFGDRREIGLIAQEVEAVLPHVVGASADGTRTLDYAKLTALLIEVAKAQQAEIAAQRGTIGGLLARVERLEAGR
jgi:hypothetical protein